MSAVRLVRVAGRVVVIALSVASLKPFPSLLSFNLTSFFSSAEGAVSSTGSGDEGTANALDRKDNPGGGRDMSPPWPAAWDIPSIAGTDLDFCTLELGL